MSKLFIRGGFIYNETDQIVGTITEQLSQEELRTIEGGGEALEAIQNFVETVNSGSLKPRKAVKEFENLLNRFKV